METKNCNKNNHKCVVYFDQQMPAVRYTCHVHHGLLLVHNISAPKTSLLINSVWVIIQSLGFYVRSSCHLYILCKSFILYLAQLPKMPQWLLHPTHSRHGGPPLLSKKQGCAVSPAVCGWCAPCASMHLLVEIHITNIFYLGYLMFQSWLPAKRVGANG